MPSMMTGRDHVGNEVLQVTVQILGRIRFSRDEREANILVVQCGKRGVVGEAKLR